MLTRLRPFLLGIRNRHLFVVDLLFFAITPALALSMRLNGPGELDPYLGSLIIYTSVFLVCKPLLLWAAELYDRYWPYASMDALRSLAKSAFGVLVMELGVSFALLYPLSLLPVPLPRSVPLISAVMTIVLVGSTRLGVRMLFEMSHRKKVHLPTKSVLIVGAGVAGAMVVRELRRHPQAGLVPVAFLDDDPRKLGARIYGLPVAGALADLPSVIKEYEAEEVIIAMPTAPQNAIDHIHCTAVRSRGHSNTYDAACVGHAWDTSKSERSREGLDRIVAEDRRQRSEVRSQKQKVRDKTQEARGKKKQKSNKVRSS